MTLCRSGGELTFRFAATRITVACVTDGNDSLTLDSWDRTEELQRLATEYPAFRFRTQQGWDRTRLRWVAERIRDMDEGLHTAITTDLADLRAALPRRREAAEREEAEAREPE
jgi:hypothetical protein